VRQWPPPRPPTPPTPPPAPKPTPQEEVPPATASDAATSSTEATATEAGDNSTPIDPSAPQKIYMPWESPIPGGRLATQQEIREHRIQKVSAMEVRRMRGVGSVASAGLAGVGITTVGQLAEITDERCNEIAGSCRNIRSLRASAQTLVANAHK
jgi:predicted flap endonuclease-1-like 5' DNA nuclease